MDKDYIRVLSGQMTKAQYAALKKPAVTEAAVIAPVAAPKVTADGGSGTSVASHLRAALSALTESRSNRPEYEGSHEFDDEFAEIHGNIHSALKVMKSVRMKKWMQETKNNYNIDTSPEAIKAIATLEAADKALTAFYNKMSAAQ